MCLFELCCVFVGYYKVKKKIAVPPNHIVPPEKILCINCGNIAQGAYFETIDRWHLCFIPCCCYKLLEEPAMGCSVCEVIFKINPNKCENCHIYNMVTVKHCPNCGVAT